MATANFPPVSTQKIYAFGFNVYDENDNIDRDVTDVYFRETLAKVEDELYNIGFTSWNDGDDTPRYKGMAIGGRVDYFIFAGVEIEVLTTAFAAAGYYEGACFDVAQCVRVYPAGGYYYSLFDDEEGISAAELRGEGFFANKGLEALFAEKLANKIEKAREAARLEAEKIFADNCEQKLIAGPSFSNGERIYHPVA